jgi:hypothetical protein
MRTLADALDNYLDFLKTNRKSADEVRSTINAIIKPELKLNSLTTERIRKWLNGVAASRARV